jgi:aerobic carbon-monoxide dehydrogenase large subunit
MGKFGTAQTAARREDLRFLTGQGRYVDDIAPPEALHAVFFRSPVAHADILGLDTAAAASAPGVAAVLTAADLEAAGVELHLAASTITNADGRPAPDPFRPVLARDRVRHVGEAVAVVLAATLDQARDASELIGFDYAERPVKLDLGEGGARLHDSLPDNLAYNWVMGDAAAVDAALAGAAHRVALRIEDNRVIVNAMEPRGAWAEWHDGRLHVAVNGQGVWELKAVLASHLGLDPGAVRVTNPDVGGGFGMKAMTYPEYIALAQAARALGRPVRWMSDRTEAMLSDNAGRDLVSVAELALDADHRILAYRVNISSNLGAYSSQNGQQIQSGVSARVVTGVYDVQTVFVNARGYYTNTTPVDAYRGAGRPEAIYTLERAMDHAARVLGVDPWALREKNFIRSFPYRTASGELYDVGDFPRVLGRVRREADVAGFPARRREAATRGRLAGLGLCCYIESILGAADEDARIEFRADGTVALYVGTQSNGQGHETVLAQFLADRTGIPADRIEVVQGDSDLIPRGGGTGGSRSVTVQGTATIAAAEAMSAAFAAFLEERLGATDFAFDGEAFRAPGTNHAITLLEAADMARAAGREDLLDHRAHATLPGRSYPNGAHVAEVEVDPETGEVAVVRYTVTDDFGVLVHPQLAQGQVHGGVAQGIGQAVTEHVVHDPHTGQLLTATFMDYAMPRADTLPMIAFSTEPVPSTANPIGMKGCGEAGTVGALAAVANAVADALADAGVAPETVQMPFTPLRVWGWIRDGTRVAAE